MEADGGALCIDALFDKTGQEISFHRRGSIDCGVACCKLTYWNSIEHAFPGTSRPAFPVPVDTYVESSHTTMVSPPVVCNVVHHGWIATTPITVFILLFLPLLRWCPAPRRELRYEVLGYCELVLLAATSKFNRLVVRDYINLRKKMLAERFFDDAWGFYGIFLIVVLSSLAPRHFTYSCLPPRPTGYRLTATSMFLARPSENWKRG